MGRKTVEEFGPEDRVLLLDTNASAAPDVERTAEGDTVFDFGNGNVLTLADVTGLAADDVLL